MKTFNIFEEYEPSPTKTVCDSVQKKAWSTLYYSVPDLWRKDVSILVVIDMNSERMEIDMQLMGPDIGVSHEIRDIITKTVRGDYSSILNELRYVSEEFGERCALRMNKF